MKAAKIISFLLMLISALALSRHLIPWILSLLSMGPDIRSASAIGIIGSADGPTSIIVASRVSPLLQLLAPVVFGLVWLGLMVADRKR